MDGLRGSFGAFEAREDSGAALPAGYDADEPETDVTDTMPPVIGTDERRMQVRAYNFWASGLADRNFPSIEDLDPDRMEDFGPNSVLLDFSKGVDDPLVAFIGDHIAAECDASEMELERLSDVPSRSLLSRITDHYMQILANQAPIGFEAEFVNQRGKTVLYRGILLPYSSDDETIDFIYGVINWKELADQKAAEDLLLELDQVLAVPASPLVRRDDMPAHAPAPLVDWADGPGAEEAVETTSVTFGAGGDLSFADSEKALGDWLAAARDMAAEARDSEDRSRNALYEAIGRAWDFALAAADAPEDFAELIEDAGLSVQERAPMTPIVKLVFGVDYDKTRLTEYAAALAHAQRMGLERGALSSFLRSSDGGLKGVVTAERALRRKESGKAPAAVRSQPRKAISRRLRALPEQALSDISLAGEEFALVMLRRTSGGEVIMLGEVPGDGALLEKAARSLLG